MKQLSMRERIALSCGAGVVVIAILVAAVLTPYRAALQNLDSRIESRRQQLVKMQGLRQEFQILAREAAVTERRLAKSKGFVLVPFLETLVTETAGREKLVYLRPQPATPPTGYREESVELKLEKVRLDHLVRLLYGVENAEACLQTRALKVKPRFDDQSLLDVVVTVSAFWGQP